MARKFELYVRLLDGTKWGAVDEPVQIEASSLDELCAKLHAALLGLGRVDPASASVAIDCVFDGDEDRTKVLQGELDSLKFRALIWCARELGVDEEEQESLDDKQSAIELILDLTGWVTVSALDDIPAKARLCICVLAEPYLNHTEASEPLKSFVDCSVNMWQSAAATSHLDKLPYVTVPPVWLHSQAWS